MPRVHPRHQHARWWACWQLWGRTAVTQSPITFPYSPSTPLPRLTHTHTHTLERDTGGRSPGHVDNDTPSEVATSHYTQSLHAGQPPALLRFRGSLLTEVINILTTPPLDHHPQRGVEQLRGLGIPSTVEALTSSARVAFRDYILRLPAPMSSR